MEKKNPGKKKNTTQAPARVRNSEIVEDNNGNEIEIYLNDVCLLLDEYQEKQNIDLHKETQSRWNGALLYIGKYFKNTKKLRLQPYEDFETSTRERGKIFTRVNNNGFDLDKVEQLCDLYIGLCYEYDKEISVMGFSKLSGIERDTIESWGQSWGTQTPKGFSIYENLIQEREETLSNRLFSSKSNPVGVLGILNHWYNWNMGQPRGNANTAPASIESIQAKYISPPSENIPPYEEYTPPVKNIPPLSENTPPIQETPPGQGNTPAPKETPPGTENSPGTK